MIEMIGMVGFLIMVGIPLRWWCRWYKQQEKTTGKHGFECLKKRINEQIKKMMDTPEQ